MNCLLVLFLFGTPASSLAAQNLNADHKITNLQTESISLLNRLPLNRHFYYSSLFGIQPKPEPAKLSSSSFFNSHASAPNLFSYSQNGIQQESKINWSTFTITSAALAGLYTSFFIYEQNERWSAPKLPFYFNSVFKTKGINKLFHFYAAKAQASVISNLYELSNVNRKTSIWLGAGIALSVQALIEIKDGKISGGGFDIYDQIANTLGVGWFYVREKSAFLKHFNIRWLYYPSEEKKLLPPEAKFSEDYSGHSFWVSVQAWNFLPKKMKPYWPRFIVPVVGISLNDWTSQSQNGYLSYHLSINPDFKYILPQETEWGQVLADFLNGFYIPAPAIEIYPDFGFKLIFYGQE